MPHPIPHPNLVYRRRQNNEWIRARIVYSTILLLLVQIHYFFPWLGVCVLYAFYIASHFNIQSEQLTRHSDAKANHFPFCVSFFISFFSRSFFFFVCIIFRRRRRCLRKHNHKRRIFRMYFVHNIAQCNVAPSSPASQRTTFPLCVCACRGCKCGMVEDVFVLSVVYNVHAGEDRMFWCAVPYVQSKKRPKKNEPGKNGEKTTAIRQACAQMMDFPFASCFLLNMCSLAFPAWDMLCDGRRINDFPFPFPFFFLVSSYIFVLCPPNVTWKQMKNAAASREYVCVRECSPSLHYYSNSCLQTSIPARRNCMEVIILNYSARWNKTKGCVIFWSPSLLLAMSLFIFSYFFRFSLFTNATTA